MTNKEDSGEDPNCDTRVVAFLAFHLVRQILDDACVIANSAADSGLPWRYQSAKSNSNIKESESDGAVSSKTESDIVNENKMEHVANVVATSTPQKVTGDFLKSKSASSFIGQGDEVEMRQNDLVKSTSMFINHLFDMSDVETIIMSEEVVTTENNNDQNTFLTQEIPKIMDSYINCALSMALEQSSQAEGDEQIEITSFADNSEYSFLSDAIDTEVDVAFYIHDADDAVGNTNATSKYDSQTDVQITEIIEITEITEECTERNNVTQFENAYLSLNRDYEQNSEDDGNLILDDPRGMTLQEIELLTANTSDENLAVNNKTELATKCEIAKEMKQLTATSAISAASKKSLVNRCRTQGARLLSCLRGWWRRRTPGKRKENQHRVQGSVRGLCPLSPDARRRAASLIDHRVLRSPSPGRGVVWKFNTVNEAIVNASSWKDYSFDKNPDECGESFN